MIISCMLIVSGDTCVCLQHAKYRKEEDRQGSHTSFAGEASIKHGKSVRGEDTLCDAVLHKERQRLECQGSKSLPRVGYWTPKKVFSTEQEIRLRNYLTEAADLYYGLSPKEVGYILS